VTKDVILPWYSLWTCYELIIVLAKCSRQPRTSIRSKYKLNETPLWNQARGASHLPLGASHKSHREFRTMPGAPHLTMVRRISGNSIFHFGLWCVAPPPWCAAPGVSTRNPNFNLDQTNSIRTHTPNPTWGLKINPFYCTFINFNLPINPLIFANINQSLKHPNNMNSVNVWSNNPTQTPWPGLQTHLRHTWSDFRGI